MGDCVIIIFILRSIRVNKTILVVHVLWTAGSSGDERWGLVWLNGWMDGWTASFVNYWSKWSSCAREMIAPLNDTLNDCH